MGAVEVTTTAFAFLNVSNPLVAWLVYRGEMISAPEVHDRALSIWATRRLAGLGAGGAGAERYKAELILDEFRRRKFPDAVSRLAGFYVFPDETTAVRAGTEWGGFRQEDLAEVGLLSGVRTSRYDSEWITHNFREPDGFVWANDYFAGNPLGQDPLWEILVDGRGLVYGTDLRERAYETIKRTWPKSLPLLELARLAVEIDSDLGLIAPMVFEDGNRYEVRYVLDFKDGDAKDFLERFVAVDGPMNREDLRPDADLVLPDLRAQFFSL